jgi:hypothetical protein
VIEFEQLIAAIGNNYGHRDIPCPVCGPHRRQTANRQRKVLRVWRDEPDFVTYSCARCGERGFARAGGSHRTIDPKRLEQLRIDSAQRNEERTVRALDGNRRLLGYRKDAQG